MSRPSRSHLSDRNLLERVDERRAIADALRAVTEGEGGVAIITGPAGVGKTALLSILAEQGAESGTVATARCSELEREFAFGVVLQLLGPLVETEAGEEIFRGAAALARPLFEGADVGVGADVDFRLLHGLHWLCANLAERAPLVICVDDVQWADAASLSFLAYLGARAAELPVLIAVSRRSGEPGELGALEQLAELPIAKTLSPSELSRDAVAELVGTELGEEAAGRIAAEVHRRSGGNPLFVDELIRATREAADSGDSAPEASPPQTVVNLVRRRVARLPAETQAVARALAILGDSATGEEIESLTGLDTEAVLIGTDRLAEAELTDPGDQRSFRHPILREAVVDSIPDGERALLRMGAARAVSGRDATRAATHLAAARPDEPCGEEWAAETLRRAAAAARARGGGGEAITYLRRALLEPLADRERREILLEVGGLEAQARDYGALKHLAAAAELASAPLERGRIALVRGDALFHFVALEECARVCREAIAGLGDDDRELRLALEATALNADALRGVHRDRPAELTDEVAAASTPGERAVLVHVASDLAATGEVAAERVREVGRRAVAGSRLLDDVGPASPTYIYAGTALAWAGDLGAVLALTTEGLERGRLSGSLIAVSYSAALRAGTALLAGDLALAESDSELVVSELPAADPMAYAVALGWLIETWIERGRLADARELLERSGLTGDLPELGTIDFLLMARAALAAAEGDRAAAIAELETVGERATRARYLNPAAMAWRSRLAELLAAAGEAERARDLVESEVERARAFGAPRALGQALRVRGKVAEEGIDDLRAAVELLDGVSAVEHARATLDLGRALHARGDESARAILYGGLDVAHGAGAYALVEQAMEALRETGARPRRPRLSGVDSLTPQERRVAGLAVAGRGNREIAESLFLTRRTVEMHLSNAYRKLGIGSREELPAALDARQP
jgi:ATP/maltotriose-dependent transcriptional regulator MalT